MNSTVYPDHPGPMLAQALRRRFGVEAERVAELLEVPNSEVVGLFSAARPVRPEMALKFEKVFGCSAIQLMFRQAEFDLIEAKTEPDVAWKLARLKPATHIV